MSFKKAQSSSVDTDDFMMDMLNNPKNLRILSVGEFKENAHAKANQKYFYIEFEDVDSSKRVKLSYNVKVNEDESVYIGQGAKLYPILSYVSHISDEAIICFKKDIDEALNGLEFEGKAIRRRFGNKKYFVLVPSSEGE